MKIILSCSSAVNATNYKQTKKGSLTLDLHEGIQSACVEIITQLSMKTSLLFLVSVCTVCLSVCLSAC